MTVCKDCVSFFQSTVCHGLDINNNETFLQQPAIQAVQTFGPYEISILIEAVKKVLEKGLQPQASTLLNALDELQSQVSESSPTSALSSPSSCTSTTNSELERHKEENIDPSQAPDTKRSHDAQTKGHNEKYFLNEESMSLETDGDCLSSEFNQIQQPPDAPKAPEKEAASKHKQQDDQQCLMIKYKALKRANELLKERQTCRQCRSQPVSITFLPCGHYSYCYDCGKTFSTCPICHKTILADVKTFRA